MDLSDAALRERVHNFWPACLGLSPYNTIIEHGISCSVTSRCCEFHEKLTAFSIALRDAAKAEQREASADLIYDLAHSMAERGLFVRNDFGEPNIHAIHELEAALRSQR